jgi:hypothetical protein
MKKRNDRSNSLNVPTLEKQGYLPAIAILFVVLALLSSCATHVTEPPVDITQSPPTEPSSEVTQPPASGVPEGAEQCKPGTETGTYTCLGLSDHEITLTGVPDKVLPYLLSVPPKREEELRQAEKEGTGCIFAIVGDLAFYDTDNNLVTDFSQTPVTLTYSFNEKDMDEFEVCKNSLVDQNLVADPGEVEFLPVYFSDKWQPFPEGTSSVDGNLAAVTVTSWGDQPFGGGTKP